jgi:putative ABC transport system permease protein
MIYALQTLWHERSRYLPGILAVSFSAVLIALQCGLLIGLFSITSIPIDHNRADVWVGSPKVLSVDLGRPIPLWFRSRIYQDRRVTAVETYYQGYGSWKKPDGGSDLCIVIGCDLNEGNMGAVGELTPSMQALLTQPGSIVVDEGELGRMGVPQGIGAKAEINRQTVQIVGLVKGLKSLAGPYIFCSRQTARDLLQSSIPRDSTTYLLVRCSKPEEAEGLVADLKKRYPDDMAVFTADEFSLHSREHWLLKTKAGIALGYAAILGLLVGAVVTSQTLYAATRASEREYAILLALGIPRWRISSMVLVQSFWVGIVGIILAYPFVNGFARLADLGGVHVALRWYILAGAAVVTLFMAMASGAVALRSVRQIEPMSLLR